ncbi:hypothetical protein EZV62_013026 [Acer yangbiense]|uniref:cathepsin H n=1 Tax=Acer yangbiense TaxID=1000413 RepID=A0A5C7HX06_9ROSI|nr:hypothetical protein EZV62_013026 [Acer yangbiense]
MARLTPVSFTILLLCCVCASAASTFDDSNPIRLVSDGLRDFEASLLQVVGHTRHALSFARFAHRSESDKSSDQTLLTGLGKSSKDTGWELHKTAQRRQREITSLPITSFLKREMYVQKDWRESGIVSPVKDQGHCGSCWTFSTTGALEAAYHQAFGKGISLSEQQLVDCAQAFNNFGCNGGLPSQAFEYIKFNGGLDTEEAYPYTGKDEACKFSSENVGVQVLNSVNITLGAEDELKHAVALVRPVSVAFEVVKSFRFYKGGVFTSTTCGSTPMDVNHAVLAVGYGVEDDVPYWLIKNSWGDSWGDNGYFKMEFGKNMCGVATCASYPVVA